MTDGLVLALIGLATVIVAGVPATVTALTSRRIVTEARDHAVIAADAAKTARDTLGEVNGNGPAMQMLARTLAQTAEVLRNQEQIKELEAHVVELSTYTHAGVHRLNGQVGMMWLAYAKQLGIDPEDLPPPQPSPQL